MSSAHGHFVTFEGGEGSGKSTQCRLAAQSFAARGLEVVATKEPGGTVIGSELRRILLNPDNKDICPETELLLYCADRAQHTSQLIQPALKRGCLVLCDRYADATLAYQGYGRQLGTEVTRIVDLGRAEPALTLLFDIPAELGLNRARQRNQVQSLDAEARFEQETLVFHERVRQGYLELAELNAKRFTLLDATLSIDELAEQVEQHISQLVKLAP